ncbi:hypothetical protein [Nonomuraea sp. SBT364]|uniref:hypothetical protein n=1 Tax=Nonomuraea sp. SBT364 TaxID=1580530 RepID=UPI00066B3BE6|nr:hypothetical protein [Nonomuraea sp. SBT364]
MRSWFAVRLRMGVFHPVSPLLVTAAAAVVLLFAGHGQIQSGTAWVLLAACSGYALSGSV